ncbi:MAG: CBS domain-containing protein [Candidatus Bathyarchaeia archaeon]
MASPQTKQILPSVIDIAYEQYKRDLPLHRQTRELMSKNVVTTSPETSLETAARLMGEKHIGSLIVLKYKTPVGIITERDLLSKAIAYGLFLNDQKVEGVMSYPLTGIPSTSKIKEAAQLMTRKKSRLAVFDAGTLVGVITASDLIKSLPDVPETEAQIEKFMTKKVVSADEETSVLNVAKTMGQERIGSVIITRKGEPFGIFTERDLLTNFLAKGKDLFPEVGPSCSSPLVVVSTDISVHRAAAIMALKHIRRLPVAQEGSWSASLPHAIWLKRTQNSFSLFLF